MKSTIYSAFVILTFLFLFTVPVFAQSTIATDSMAVEWEQLEGPPGPVFRFAESGNKLFAGTDNGLYTSTDNGKNWRFNKGLGKGILLNFGVRGNVLYAVVKEDLYRYLSAWYFVSYDKVHFYRSLDSGVTWEQTFDSGALAGIVVVSDYQRPDILITKDTAVSIIVHLKQANSTYSWHSTDSGETWLRIDSGQVSILGATAIGDTISGILRQTSPPNAQGFIEATGNFQNNEFVDVSTLSGLGGDGYFTTYHNGVFSILLKTQTIYQTTDYGLSWTINTLPVPDSIREISWADDGYFYIRAKTGVWRGNLAPPFSFTQVFHGEGGHSPAARTFSALPSGYWVNSDLLLSMYSSNQGVTWEDRSKGLVSDGTYLSSYCGKLLSNSGNPSFPTVSKFISNQEDGEWQSTNGVPFDRILGEANGAVYGYFPLVRSLDCGVTWDTIQYPDINLQAYPEEIIQSGNRTYLWSKYGVPILFSDNNGDSWLEMSEPQQYAECESLVIYGDTLLYVSSTFGPHTLYRSYNNGQSWESMPLNPAIKKIYKSDNGKIIGLSEGNSTATIFVSTNHGTSWIQTFTTNLKNYFLPNQQNEPRIRFPLVWEGMILMYADNGVFVSHNEGLNWTKLTNLPFSNFALVEPNGQTNLDYLTGTYVKGARSYFVNEGYLYAATETQGIWRTPYAPIRDHLKVQSSEYGFLSGRLYRDADGDCQYNLLSGDKPLGFKPVLINPGNQLTNTDANGLYSVALTVGNYSVTATAPNYYAASCTTDTVSAAISLGNTVTADLPYSAIPGMRDLCVLITTPVAARPGFNVTYKIQVSNVGTTAVSDAVLTFSFGNQWLTPVSVVPFGQFSGNDAIIPLPTIAPGEVTIITLTFNILQSTPLGSILTFTADCPVTDDANPANNLARASQTVTGSFDPNDKTALPVLPQPPGQSRVLDYLIRFQNTGTDTAFTVVVTDTIAAALDLLTLRTVESSHDFQFSILPGRVCQWRFRNILLPDSNTNESASHGYLRFQIETNAGLIPGTSIRNKADIFFDFNSPVRTNEAASENPKWVVTEVSDVVLCSGDTWNGTTWTNSETLIDTVGNAWSDTISFVHLEVLPRWELHFDTMVNPGTTLFNTLVWQDTIFNLQYLSAEGCDSIIFWNVTVQTSAIKDVVSGSILFDLQPNPATNTTWLRVKMAGSSEIQSLNIQLFNASGMLIRSWNNVEVSVATPCSVDLDGLAAGIYFVAMQSAQISGIRRLVKM